MASTSIQWTNKVWNPVTGCTKVSPGCAQCYASRMAHRLNGRYGYPLAPNEFKVTLHPDRLNEPLTWHKPSMIFVDSMGDLFHKDVPDEYIAMVWQVISSSPQHTFQILTKRPDRMQSWANRWYAGEIPEPYRECAIDGYPGYVVTTRGQVYGKRSDTNGGMKQDIGEQGHRRVALHREGSPRSGTHELVHRLVLSAFARQPRPNEQACHRNGDPSDNRLSNLYWGTQEDNWQDRIRHGNGRSYAKLTEQEVIEIRGRYDSGETANSLAKVFEVSDTQIRNIVTRQQWNMPPALPIPKPPARVILKNCWLGVSAENQAAADERIPLLLQTPAAVRFVSVEPMLGPVNLALYLPILLPDGMPVFSYRQGLKVGLDWVICGCESGPKARTTNTDWVWDLNEQCQMADVSFFLKQLVINGKLEKMPTLDGRVWDQMPEVTHV